MGTCLQKGEFKVGDTCVYIEIDSIVPELPVFEFLRERKFRVKTIKLRGQISQGLALPIEYFDQLRNERVKIGQDVTSLLGVTKYDPQGDKERELLLNKYENSKNLVIRFLAKFSLFQKLFLKPTVGILPNYITSTKLDRIQIKPNILEKYKDRIFVETEKLDGCSATYWLIERIRWGN